MSASTRPGRRACVAVCLAPRPRGIFEGVSDWFFMLGESLDASERRQARGYLEGLGIDGAIDIVGVSDWEAARRAIADPEWDQRWWDAEQRERRRLYDKARAARGEDALLAELTRAIEPITETVHGSAAVEAARRGCSDPGLIRAAAGAAAEALYLSQLARLAGEGAEHPFALKQALFAGGHWPLGIVHGRFHVF